MRLRTLEQLALIGVVMFGCTSDEDGHGAPAAGDGAGGAMSVPAGGGAGGTSVTAGGGGSVAAAAPDENACVAGVSLGLAHTCTVKRDGALWCWGRNMRGQLGDGTTEKRFLPVHVAALGTSVAEVAAGDNHTCARKTDGSVWCWGDNTHGMLGHSSGEMQVASPRQVDAIGTSAVQIAVGASHSCARTNDGSLWCWGLGGRDPLDPSRGDSAIPQRMTALGTGVTDVVLGANHGCAISNDGSLSCWGRNREGEIGDGTTDARDEPVQVGPPDRSIAQAALGTWHTCALSTDGSLWCWGDNQFGQLGDGTTTGHAVPTEATAFQRPVDRVAAACGVSGGNTCVLDSDKSLWCWGHNEYGQLANDSTVDSVQPVQVAALGTSVVDVGLACYRACASKADGSLWCWGINNDGQLGDGTSIDAQQPIQIEPPCADPTDP